MNEYPLIDKGTETFHANAIKLALAAVVSDILAAQDSLNREQVCIVFAGFCGDLAATAAGSSEIRLNELNSLAADTLKGQANFTFKAITRVGGN